MPVSAVTPENLTGAEPPAGIPPDPLIITIEPASTGAFGAAAFTWTVRVPVIGPLLAVGLVLALALNVTVRVGAPAANDHDTVSPAVIPLVLLNVKYDVPCSEIE